MKVTCVPWQNEFVGVEIVTDGVTLWVTDMVMLLLITRGVIAQASLLVISQRIISLLARFEVVQTGEFVPIGVPFFFHWNTGVDP